MKLKITMILMVLLMSANLFAESIARSSLTYMLSRYSTSKDLATEDDAEISLACAGEVLANFGGRYLSLMQELGVNVALVNNYQQMRNNLEGHKGDIEQVYSIFRENMITALRHSFINMQKNGTLAPIPQMTIDNYGKTEIVQHFEMCNNPDFIASIAAQAPLTADPETNISRTVYRVPLTDGEDDFEDIVNGGSPDTQKPKLVTVTQTISEWLYEIQKR